MASRDPKLYADPLLVVDNDIEFGKSVIECDVLGNKISLSAGNHTFFAVCGACNDLGELPSRIVEIFLCFGKCPCDVAVVA